MNDFTCEKDESRWTFRATSPRCQRWFDGNGYASPLAVEATKGPMVRRALLAEGFVTTSPEIETRQPVRRG